MCPQKLLDAGARQLQHRLPLFIAEGPLLGCGLQLDVLTRGSHGDIHIHFGARVFLVAKIKQAFFTFPWDGSALAAEFKKEGKFIPIDYKKDWAVLRKIDAANGVKYTCK